MIIEVLDGKTKKNACLEFFSYARFISLFWSRKVSKNLVEG